jgi:hypothetical protein
MRRLLSITLVLALASLSWVELYGKDEVAFTATELLGRPTDSSVTVNVLAEEDLEVYFEYGTESGVYAGRTDTALFPGGDPIEVVMDGLQPDTRYYYRMVYRQSGATEWTPRNEYSFHTQRARGSSFVFTVQADSHLGDPKFNAELYEIVLQNASEAEPDLHLDLGDTFMSEKYASNYDETVALHLEQRGYFGILCHSVPLFLATGNHEGELGWKLDGTAENIAVWATTARKLYYLNPVPDEFYTGCAVEEDFVGLRENYYGWEWGDALFVVLDPFWYTTTKPGQSGDNWDWTLGYEQYSWFQQVLEGSDATFKFVFCHHLVGGVTTAGRGGIEGAGYYEWGGKNEDDSWGFDGRRPGWGTPIHQLMLENNVTIFFHGHDHFFAKQDLDGIVYQLVPQPSNTAYDNTNNAEKYGYVNGDFLGSSGHLRVTVGESQVTADYVRAYLPGDGTNGEIAYSYTISADTTGIYPDCDELSRIKGFSLLQNYPNPFNPVTRIQYTVGSSQTPIPTTLRIYDIPGKLVRTLVNEPKPAGSYQVVWDGKNENGKDVASGIYFCKLKVGDQSQTKKMILIK